MRVLLLTPYLPHARVGHGGGTAVREMCRQLARVHELHVISLVRSGESDLVEATAADLGCRIHPLDFHDQNVTGIHKPALILSRLWAGGRGILRGYPYYVEKYWSKGLSRRILALVEDIQPDAVQIEYLQLSLLTKDLRTWKTRQLAAGHKTPVLCASTHELGSVPRLRRAKLTTNPLSRLMLRAQAAAWRRLQRDATHWSDLTFCVTDDDRAILEADGGLHCLTVPLGMDTDTLQPDRDPADSPRLLFVGSFGHGPNRTAAKFLIDNVWPQVAKYRTDAVLDVVGRGSRRFLDDLGVTDSRVRGHGFVEDLSDFYRCGTLFVAPLPEGGGIKIKILEAMARGIPVVTTPVGAEGIVLPRDDAAWIVPADDRFHETVIAALDDPAQAVLKATKARRIMEEQFSWRGIVNRLTEHYGGG